MGSLPTWTCEGGSSTSKDICKPVCGDNIILLDSECEDNNTIDLDGCSKDCLIEPKYVCKGLPSVCNACGDGKVMYGEICDAGKEVGCLEDCSGEKDGYDCSGGTETKASNCTISLQAV